MYFFTVNSANSDCDGDTGIGGHGHNHDHEYAANLYSTASLLKDVADVPRAAGTITGPGHIHVLGDDRLLGTKGNSSSYGDTDSLKDHDNHNAKYDNQQHQQQHQQHRHNLDDAKGNQNKLDCGGSPPTNVRVMCGMDSGRGGIHLDLDGFMRSFTGMMMNCGDDAGALGVFQNLGTGSMDSTIYTTGSINI